jgi:hypothetical protein
LKKIFNLLKINGLFYYFNVHCPRIILLVPPLAGFFLETDKDMFEKKTNIFKSPDLSKLKEVVIDHRTKIYIAPEADIQEAKNRYFERITTRRIK